MGWPNGSSQFREAPLPPCDKGRKTSPINVVLGLCWLLTIQPFNFWNTGFADNLFLLVDHVQFSWNSDLGYHYCILMRVTINFRKTIKFNTNEHNLFVQNIRGFSSQWIREVISCHVPDQNEARTKDRSGDSKIGSAALLPEPSTMRAQCRLDKSDSG